MNLSWHKEIAKMISITPTEENKKAAQEMLNNKIYLGKIQEEIAKEQIRKRMQDGSIEVESEIMKEKININFHQCGESKSSYGVIGVDGKFERGN